MDPNWILEQRRLARGAKQASDAELRHRHLRVTAALCDPTQADAVRSQALQHIDLWERQQLCHRRYIDGWRHILDLPVRAMCDEILRDDAAGVALRQNSPFGFLLGREAA